jgi:1-acyl-sn-glycerol-3-phosphate acyltransferase
MTSAGDRAVEKASGRAFRRGAGRASRKADAAKQVENAERHRWFVGLCRFLGHRILFPLTCRYRVRGREHVPPTGGVVLASNHTNILDGPVLFAASPRRATFMVKSEMFGAGFLGWALRRLGQLPVNRGSADRHALQTAIGTLREGGVVGVFPEGTRGAGDVDEVQHGIAYLALRAGCPIVPVVIEGTSALLAGGRPHWRRPVTVVFGEPFQVGTPGARDRSRRSIAAAADEIRDRLASHVSNVRAADAARGKEKT